MNGSFLGIVLSGNKPYHFRSRFLKFQLRITFFYSQAYLSQYIGSTFQQFADLAIFDDKIGADVEIEYIDQMNKSFENDIKKSTADFIRACVDNGLEAQGGKINKYFQALGQSAHANYDDVYKICYERLIDKMTRFTFYNLLSGDNPIMEKIKYKLAKLAVIDYEKDSNTESHKLELTEMKKLIEEVEGRSKPTNSPTPSSSG